MTSTHADPLLVYNLRYFRPSYDDGGAITIAVYRNLLVVIQYRDITAQAAKLRVLLKPGLDGAWLVQ